MLFYNFLHLTMTAIPSSVLGSLVYPPQTYGSKPTKTHVTSRDSAKNTSAIDLSPSADDKDVAYEMHTMSKHLSERTRRPSAITRTSSAIHPGGGEISKDPIRQDSNTSAQASSTSLPVLPFGSANATVSRLADKQFRRTSMIQFVTLCWCVFVEGWSDGSTGPLLPVIQRDYHVRSYIISCRSTH